MAGEAYPIVLLRLLDLAGDCRLALLFGGPYDRLEQLEVASGQVLLMPLVGLAKGQGEIWMASFDVEARTRAAQMHLSPGLPVREMKHYDSLPSTITYFVRGAMLTAHCPPSLLSIPQYRVGFTFCNDDLAPKG